MEDCAEGVEGKEESSGFAMAHFSSFWLWLGLGLGKVLLIDLVMVR